MRFLTYAIAMTATLTTTLVSPATAAPPSGADAACKDLSKGLTSSAVILPSSASYSAAQYGGFNPLNNKLTPSCIVQPTTPAQVSAAVKAINRANAPYAVRAGGHTGMAGWDSVTNGILIDFSKMTGFSYNPQTSTVTVEPGLRWGDIYNQSAVHGVAPMGGRVEHVGTGLILGGGLSLLSPQYGYACDGLVSATIVDPKGQMKKVDAKSDANLLRAIKGGGGRFGIVISYELKAFPTGTNNDKNWFGGSITILTPTGMDQSVEATEKFVLTPDDPKATLLTNVGMLKQAGAPLFLGSIFLFYKGSQAEFNSVFADFLAIPGAIIDVKPLSYLEAAAITPLGWKPTQAYKWMGGSLYATSPSPAGAYSKAWNNAREFLLQHVDIIDSGFFSITPVGTTQIEQGYANGGNALTPPKGRNYMHWLFSSILADGTTSFPQAFDESREQFLAQNPSDQGLPLFLNEVDTSQKTFQSYGWYEQLKQEYSKFDPSGISVRNQVGPTF